jgi:hypothetical protein
MSGHGRAAYTAYWDAVGGRTPDDKVMPYWHKLNPADKAAWALAALAAIARHEHLKTEDGG